jgi:hypothetical protein
MNNVKMVVLIWDISELMSSLYHDARSMSKKQGPINLLQSFKEFYNFY